MPPREGRVCGKWERLAVASGFLAEEKEMVLEMALGNSVR
jgi:hypothetical protein